MKTGQPEIEAVHTRSWHLLDFPLVAMAIAISYYAVALVAAILILQVLPPMSRSLSEPIHAAAYVGLGLFAYKAGIRFLGEHPRDDLQREDALRGLGLGLIAGFLIFAAIVGLAAVAGVYRVTGCCSTGAFITDLFGVAILPAFMEELFFRGILFRWLEEFGGSWLALALSSLAFGFVHYGNPGSSVAACLWIAAEAGVLLGGAYMLTRSLWMPMALHASWNLTQGFVFGAPVSGMTENGFVSAKLSGPALLSGGDFGLEASIFALLVATAAGIWMVLLAVRRGQVIEPWWTRRRIA